MKQMNAHLLPQEARILDLGSGGRRLAQGIISVDIDHSASVDVIASASELPFRTAAFDLIISTAMLEHVIDIQGSINEIARCCKTGGLIYIEIPFLQPYHAHPHDYRRYTLPGLEQALSQFQKLESGVCVGPFSVFAWHLRKLPRFLAGERWLGLVLEFIAGWLTFWIKYLDAIIPGARQAHQAASGLFFLGKKR